MPRFLRLVQGDGQFSQRPGSQTRFPLENTAAERRGRELDNPALVLVEGKTRPQPDSHPVHRVRGPGPLPRRLREPGAQLLQLFVAARWQGCRDERVVLRQQGGGLLPNVSAGRGLVPSGSACGFIGCSEPGRLADGPRAEDQR